MEEIHMKGGSVIEDRGDWCEICESCQKRIWQKNETKKSRARMVGRPRSQTMVVCGVRPPWQHCGHR